ncbi:hypothetical protein ABFU82_21830 [Nocardioides sp. WV_118_6]|uniref:hypothetical protein n=1 Tax=Nocardioides simplex TaxID=2045 RepID=UPI002150000E|nr:hypothetical protein [Pimelobacter simplex]UUW91320.1 hypothetical protein M0M43_07470 [Pimelobacter simplex]UUW95148.1 hypothetical protein M0M48_25975 [Pimelobacter simplex]
MFTIVLDIFSGVPNPVWTLSPSQGASLREQIADGAAPVVGIDQVETRLGYLGYIVHATGDDADALSKMGLPNLFRLSSEAAGRLSRAEIERELARDARGATLNEPAQEALWEAVDSEAVEPFSQVEPSSPGKLAAAACNLQGTSFSNFSFWNGVYCTRVRNNCYNYATNDRTDNFAQPGYRSNTGFGGHYPNVPAPTVTNIRNGALGDGLKMSCSGDKLRVWFAIWPGTDYHWWRLNKNDAGTNRWCHKRGTSPATNKDQNGDFIVNVKNSARWNYSVDGEFMFVNSPQGNVKGWGGPLDYQC